MMIPHLSQDMCHVRLVYNSVYMDGGTLLYIIIREKLLRKGLRILSLLHNSEKLDNVETQVANNYDKCSEEDCELCGSI